MGEDMQVVTLRGDVDLAVRAEVRAVLEPAIAAPEAVIDLVAVHYIDSAGISELLAAAARRRALALPPARLVVKPNGNVARIIELAGLRSILPIYATLEEALR